MNIWRLPRPQPPTPDEEARLERILYLVQGPRQPGSSTRPPWEGRRSASVRTQNDQHKRKASEISDSERALGKLARVYAGSYVLWAGGA